MSIRTAITSLAAFGSTVSGVGHSYDIDVIPQKLDRQQMPVLIIVPESFHFMTKTMMGNSVLTPAVVCQILLFGDVALPIAQVLPKLIDFVDNYTAAAKASPTLNYQTNPVQQIVMQYVATIGQTEYAGTLYHSVEFKHTLNLQ